MLKSNMIRSTILFVALFALPIYSLAPSTRMQKAVDGNDLELTRKLLMHILTRLMPIAAEIMELSLTRFLRWI